MVHPILPRPAGRFRPGGKAFLALAALSLASIPAAELPTTRHSVAGLARDVEILVDHWAHDSYFPLLFDRSAVEKSTEQRIVLVATP